uniref:Ribosomal protein S8 n=1 Tax=Acrasis kona TaxID=1008807 RepID=A0A0B4MZG9_9EUKA|nr:ribosomal protein S8 [Acrasis kona]AID52051.1 ribosomal protein S8 [Acrasis kona]
MNNLFSLIKKGILNRSIYVKVHKNRRNINLVKYLYKKGYFFSYIYRFKYIYVYLKYFENQSVIQNIHINNKKKKHINNISYKLIKKQYLYGKNDILLISKIGIINMKKALYYKIGGNILVTFTI